MIGRAAGVASLVAGFATLAIVLLISWDVTMRSFFDRPQLFVDEVASFLEVLVIFGGAAYTFRAGGHVRVDLITGLARPSARAWLRVATLTLGVAFLAVVIWVTTQPASRRSCCIHCGRRCSSFPPAWPSWPSRCSPRWSGR